MEDFKFNKKESAINRFVGLHEDDESFIQEHFKYRHENQNLGINEWQKTPEVLNMIEKLNDAMAVFLRRYGVEAIRINPEAVHVLDIKNLSEEEVSQIKRDLALGEGSAGIHNAVRQSIEIFEDYEENKLFFWQILVHEMLHMQGFNSYQITDEENSDFSFSVDEAKAGFNLRRSGFAMGSVDGETTYYRFLNEAVITELQILFEREFVAGFQELKPDLDLREKVINFEATQYAGIDEIAAVVEDTANGNFKCSSYGYVEERQQLAELIEKLYEGNRDKFSDKEEIFKLFAEATISGRVLPVARLIESTLGKGEFRSIGVDSGV